MSDIEVNYPRIADLADTMAAAIAQKPGKTTERFIAALVAALKVAHDAQPDQTPDAIADLVGDVMGNVLLEYRTGRFPVKFVKAGRGARGRRNRR